MPEFSHWDFLWLLLIPLIGAVTQNALVTAQALKWVGATIANADSFIAAAAASPLTAPTNTKLIYTAGANGSSLKAIAVTSDSTSAHILSLWGSIDGGTTKYLLGQVNIPIGAGFLSGTTAGIDFLVATGGPLGLLEIDAAGKPCINVPSTFTMYAGVTIAAVTANKTVYILVGSQDL